MLDLGRPDIDWVGVARSLGVPGARVTNMEEFNRRFADAVASPGPFLVEVVLSVKISQRKGREGYAMFAKPSEALTCHRVLCAYIASFALPIVVALALIVLVT